MHKYLVDEIDELRKKYNINRTDIIEEAIRSYISQQKESEFYKGFEKSCKELQEVLEKPQSKNLQSLEVLIDELENISDEK